MHLRGLPRRRRLVPHRHRRAERRGLGGHLPAGHRNDRSGREVVLAGIVVPRGTIRERHAHLPAGGVRDRVLVPAIPVQGHLLGRARPLAVRLVMHLRGLPRRRRLVPHRHRLLRHVRDRHRDARAPAARGRLDRGPAGLRTGGDHASAHHVRHGAVARRPRDLAVRRVVGLDRRGQLRARPGLQRELAAAHAITGDRDGRDRNRIIGHSNSDRSRLTASGRCNRCSTSLHSGDFAIGYLSRRTIRAGPRNRLVGSVGRIHSSCQLHARAGLQAQLSVAHTGT